MVELDLDSKKAAEAEQLSETEKVLTEYMRIVINSETYLIPVSAVLSILRPVTLTPVLMAPAHLMGLANIRGQIFCVVDPGKALGLPHKREKRTSESRFLLLRHARVHLGIWVEEVFDMHYVAAPEQQDSSSNSYKLGSVETPQGKLPVLRVEALFD